MFFFSMKLLILIKLCYLKEVNSFFTSKIFIKKIKVNINLKSSIEEYTHLLDYLPYRQEGLGAWEDFRTSPIAPTTLRDRKMYLKFFSFFNFEKKNLESVLDDPLWPSKWPFGNEDFRPFDYTRDEVINILPQYSYSQSLIKSDQIQIIPGLFRLPTRRHFILPKDKISLSDHMSIMLKNYVGIDDNREGLRVLELFSCYESILPTGKKLGPTIGIGWDNEEIESNADIDDYIIQDITIDPYIPLKSNYFDIVIIPANIQLLQRPLTLFQEINRVLKVGGYCFAGLKLCHWSFLTNKLGRYYAETNYLEDIYTLGAFFHYSQGYTKPKAYDLTLPELTLFGNFFKKIFINKRLDFYSVVQSRKTRSSPHQGENENKNENDFYKNYKHNKNQVIGSRYAPKVITNTVTGERNLGPLY